MNSGAGLFTSGHSTMRLIIGQRCPDEADVLAYFEKRLPAQRRTKVEKHVAACDDCRESLALLARLQGAESDQAHGAGTSQLAEQVAIETQTARVLELIEKDERRRSHGLIPWAGVRTAGQAQGRFWSPALPAAAAVLLAVAVGLVYLATRGQSPAESAMRALSLAVKKERLTPVRISGLPHSPYRAVTRGAAETGPSESSELQFERALGYVKFAEASGAPAEARLALARIYLERGDYRDVKKALQILQELLATGVESPEAFNEIGAAQFQLEQYAAAVDSFDKALAKSPKMEEALFNRALAKERLGDVASPRERATLMQEAARDWEAFLDTSPEQNWKEEARSHLELIKSKSVK